MKKTAKKKAGDFPKDDSRRALHASGDRSRGSTGSTGSTSTRSVTRARSPRRSSGSSGRRRQRPRSRLARPPSLCATALLRSPRASRRRSRNGNRGCLSQSGSFPSWTDHQWWAGAGRTLPRRREFRPACRGAILPGRLTFANPRSLIFAKKNQAKFGMALIEYWGAREPLDLARSPLAPAARLRQQGSSCSNARSTRPSASSRAPDRSLRSSRRAGVRSGSRDVPAVRAEGANHAQPSDAKGCAGAGPSHREVQPEQRLANA